MVSTLDFIAEKSGSSRSMSSGRYLRIFNAIVLRCLLRFWISSFCCPALLIMITSSILVKSSSSVMDRFSTLGGFSTSDEPSWFSISTFDTLALNICEGEMKPLGSIKPAFISLVNFAGENIHRIFISNYALHFVIPSILLQIDKNDEGLAYTSPNLICEIMIAGKK